MAKGQGRPVGGRGSAGKTRIAVLAWSAQDAERLGARMDPAWPDVRKLVKPVAPDLRELTARPPDAFVISLDGSPSAGRDVALYLRSRAATRYRPVVFVATDLARDGRVRELLPDAPLVSPRALPGALRSALARPPSSPVSPGALAGYSGTPLPRKLGIREGSIVALVGAPRAFRALLRPLPAGARLITRPAPGCHVVVLFARTAKAMGVSFRPSAAALGERGRLWIAWPKKTSKLAGDLGEREVRAFGLESGWVDYKVAALDTTWAGLCFARKRA